MDNNDQKIVVEEKIADEICGIKIENAELEKEVMEEKLSTSNEKAADDDEIGNQEEKAIKKSLNFHGFLPHVLDWNKRTELAISYLSTSSDTFRQYCWPHFHGWKVKPHIVKKLEFSSKKNDDGNWQCILIKDDDIVIPIAEINPPEYICGFEEIGFEHFDDCASQFMQKILPMLNQIEINFQSYEWLKTTEIRDLLTLLAPKASKLSILCTLLNQFNKKFPKYFNDIQSIYLPHCYLEVDLYLIMKWLHAPRDDGKPKILEITLQSTIEERNLITNIEQEFSQSDEPANFTIRMSFYEIIGLEVKNFKIENDMTGEILELERKEPNKHILFRYKKGNEKVEELERKANSTCVKIGALV